MVRVNKTDYGFEWAQALFIAFIIGIASFALFSWGGFDLSDENGRLFFFIWAFVVGIVATYFAIFKWKKSLVEGLGGGYL